MGVIKKMGRYRRYRRPNKWVKSVRRLSEITGKWKMKAKHRPKKRIVGYEPSGEPIYGT
jgi:hypothetical protein